LAQAISFGTFTSREGLGVCFYLKNSISVC
jgi:hypothetical protein